MTATATDPRPTITVPAPIRNTFAGVLKSEFIKLWSLRSMRVTLILTVLVAAGISLLGAWVLGMTLPAAELAGDADIQLMYVKELIQPPVMFQALLFGILGVFAVSSEYSSGMILSTLGATPKRGRLIWAKLVAVMTIALAAVVLTLVITFGIAVAFEPATIAVLVEAEIVTSVVGICVFLLAMTVLAFGVATLLRSTAGGIAVVAGITFVLPIAFSFAAMADKLWIDWILDHLPLPVSGVASAGLQDAATAETMVMSWGESLITIVVWALVFLIPALFVFQKRDAK